MPNNLTVKLRDIINNHPAYIRRYLWPLPKFRKEVVVMIDGKLPHGGLTDRFRNILSVYSYCKSHNIPFKVNYVYPCQLTSILLPNKYDWRIAPSEISYHILGSKELILYVTPIESTIDECKKQNNNIHLNLLDEALGNSRKIQYRLYGNSFFAEGHYKELFEELFKPTSYLESRIKQCLNCMDLPYEAVTLRFQQLLGDFDEGNFEILAEQERGQLIEVCSNKIKQLYGEGYFHTEKVLVTSDSPSFVEVIGREPFTYTIPGRMEHMDFTKDADLDMNAKSFVDMFLLMRSERITLLQTGKMYKSGFPEFAAELGGKQFEIISF